MIVPSARSEFRYVWCPWDQPTTGSTLCAVGFNPSTADQMNDDPTTRRLRGIATELGHARIVLVNLYAGRSSDPKDLLASTDLGDDAVNDAAIAKAADSADQVLVAWGRIGTQHKIPGYRARGLRSGDPASVPAVGERRQRRRQPEAPPVCSQIHPGSAVGSHNRLNRESNGTAAFEDPCRSRRAVGRWVERPGELQVEPAGGFDVVIQHDGSAGGSSQAAVVVVGLRTSGRRPKGVPHVRRPGAVSAGTPTGTSSAEGTGLANDSAAGPGPGRQRCRQSRPGICRTPAIGSLTGGAR